MSSWTWCNGSMNFGTTFRGKHTKNIRGHWQGTPGGRLTLLGGYSFQRRWLSRTLTDAGRCLPGEGSPCCCQPGEADALGPRLGAGTPWHAHYHNLEPHACGNWHHGTWAREQCSRTSAVCFKMTWPFADHGYALWITLCFLLLSAKSVAPLSLSRRILN